MALKKDFSATLTSKRNLAGNVWELNFGMQNGEVLDFKPGQYLLLKIEDKIRQYSMSSPATEKDGFSFVAEYFPGGLASTFFDGLQVGEAAHFRGPGGVFTLQDTPAPKVFLVTGTGIAPVKSMIDTALGGESGMAHAPTAQMRLLFGLKSRADMYLFDHFLEHARAHENFDFDVCLTREENLDGLDPQHVAMGRVNSVYDVMLEEEASWDPMACEYYLCGSEKVVESLKEYVASLGIPNEQTFFESFI